MNTKNGKPLPAMTFAHLKSIDVPAGSISVRFDEVFVDSGFALDLEDLVQQYLTRKYVPSGGQGVFEARVTQLSVKKDYEPADSQIVRSLELGGRDVYDLSLAVKFSYLDEAAGVYRTLDIQAGHRFAISEHVSLAEREQAQMQAVEDLFADFHLRAYSALR